MDTYTKDAFVSLHSYEYVHDRHCQRDLIQMYVYTKDAVQSSQFRRVRKDTFAYIEGEIIISPLSIYKTFNFYSLFYCPCAYSVL